MDKSEELRYLLLALHREGNRQLTEALRPLGVTPSQAEVIQVLQQYQPMTLLQLGERLVCEMGSPSRLVKTMVEAGWVEKSANPEDGRAILLSISSKTKKILPQLNQIEAEFNQQAAAVINDEMLDMMVKQLWLYLEDSSSGQALIRRKLNK